MEGVRANHHRRENPQNLKNPHRPSTTDEIFSRHHHRAKKFLACPPKFFRPRRALRPPQGGDALPALKNFRGPCGRHSRGPRTPFPFFSHFSSLRSVFGRDRIGPDPPSITILSLPKCQQVIELSTNNHPSTVQYCWHHLAKSKSYASLRSDLSTF